MFVKEPAEQVLIAQMRKLRKRMSLRKLASKLEQDGVRTRAGTPFSAMQIHRILSREQR
jgi:hypothetical protein